MWGAARVLEQVVPIILNQSLVPGPGPALATTLFSSLRSSTPENSYPPPFISISKQPEATQTRLSIDSPEALEVLAGDLEPRAKPRAGIIRLTVGLKDQGWQ